MIPEGNPTREDRADKGRSLRAEGHGGLTFLRGLKSSKANCPNVSLWETWHRCHVPSNPIQPIGWPTATEKFGVAVGQGASCGLANCHHTGVNGTPHGLLRPGSICRVSVKMPRVAAAARDRLSQARNRWLRQAVASSRPLVAKSFSAASQANPAALGRAPICAPQSFDPPI